jgi:5'-phosphate synthase pdxT subunit
MLFSVLTPSAEDPLIQIVAQLPTDILPKIANASDSDLDPTTIVALHQGMDFLTTFHSELIQDNRISSKNVFTQL